MLLKKNKNCMQFKNCTADILSEKEVSYSSILKCESDFEETNSVDSIISQTSTDDSTCNLKKNILKFSEIYSPGEQTSEEKSGCLTVNLRDFDTFEQMSCSKDEFDDTTNNLIGEETHEGSIISLSDDDDMDFYKNDALINQKDTSLDQSRMSSNLRDCPITYSVEHLTQEQELCLPKLSVQQTANLLLLTESVNKSNEEKGQTASLKHNNSETIAEELLQSTLLEKSTEITSCKTPLRTSRSLNFIIPSTKASKKYEHDKSSAKIIILSDISLGFSPGISHNDSAKIYQDLCHDHSYTNLQQPVSNRFLNATPSSSKTKYVGQNDVIFTKDQYKDPNFDLSDIIESSLASEIASPVNKIRENDELVFKKPIKKLKPLKTITLRAGKTYRRSLSMLRRSSVFDDVLSTTMCPNDCLCAKCLFGGKLNGSSCRRSFQIVPASPNGNLPSNSSLETYARRCSSYVQEQDLIGTDLDDSLRNLSLISNSRNSLINHCDSLPVVTAKDIVLRRCGQTEILPFEECYPRSLLQNCQKIGEGVYGEVFLYRNQSGGTSVMKIIPIEGDLIVNGEKQKKFDEIVSEIVISMELSNLRNNKKNCTSCFTEVQKVRCARGSYPDRLLDLWDLYDETRGSENDSPQMFSPDQLYIVLELTNGGQDLESSVFTNALQVFAVFKQTACALAVAESQLKFEHRDLHWGNILISSVDKNKTLHFRLNGKDIEIDTHGVEVSIIDFTLSRVEFDGVVVFNDLSHDDELFVAKGDYQFEIYRLMQQNNSNEWQHFEPYSNILWLHYLLDKAVTSALRYKNSRTKIHKEYLEKLKKMKEQILSFNSVVEFVVSNFI